MVHMARVLWSFCSEKSHSVAVDCNFQASGSECTFFSTDRWVGSYRGFRGCERTQAAGLPPGQPPPDPLPLPCLFASLMTHTGHPSLP